MSQRRDPIAEALRASEWPANRHDRHVPVRDTTLRQVGVRLTQAHNMVADGLAEVAALTGLRAEMVEARALSVKGLPEEVLARHRTALRLASGASDGVEMW